MKEPPENFLIAQIGRLWISTTNRQSNISSTKLKSFLDGDKDALKLGPPVEIEPDFPPSYFFGSRPYRGHADLVRVTTSNTTRDRRNNCADRARLQILKHVRNIQMNRILLISVLAITAAGCTDPYDPGQRAVGGGLLGAGAGAAIGGLAGGGRGAAAGALIGGGVGAVGGAVTTPRPPPPAYYQPAPGYYQQPGY
jgi:hypothetical protein